MASTHPTFASWWAGNLSVAVRPLLLLVLVLALVGAGCGSDSNEGGPEEDAGGTVIPETGEDVGGGSGNINVALREQGDAGATGSATITAEEGVRTRVVVQVEGGGRSALTAGIYEGGCESLGSSAHELEPVEEGRSETVLEDVDIDDLQDGEYAIVVSEGEGGESALSCGEFGSAG